MSQDSREDSPREDGGFGQLRGVMSEAAVSVLTPVAKTAATNAAKLAVKRGPELLEDTILPKLQDLGGRLGGGDDDDEQDGAGDGTGQGRRMPIQQAVDVAAPLEAVYEQFTNFEDFPKFMHRVESVEERGEDRVVFHEKIWGVRRQWEAEIVDEEPCARIVWRTVSGMKHVGVITFHELSERLTRIELNVDVDPDGAFEKVARGGRFIKRAARADLKRFKAYVEMHDEHGEGYVEDDEDEEEREQSGRATGKSSGNGGRAKSRSSSSGNGGRAKSRSSSSGNGRSGSGRRKSTRAKASSGKSR